MLKSQSEFIRIQPFIQSLRPSVYLTKENCSHDYSQHGSQMFKGDKIERSCRKSMSKSKTLTFKRKTSINMGRQNFCPKWFFNNGQLDIYFNQILSKTGSLSQLKTDRHISAHIESLNINTIQIQILFTKYETENFQKGSLKKIKMTIKSTEISIQDESKVKRSFTIDLAQKMQQKKCLRIITSQQFKPTNIFLNGKLISCQFTQNDLPSNQICVVSPWQLINEQKTFLQNRILSERPKSKIKWNTQFKENEQQKNELFLSNLTKRDEVQLDYGLRSSKKSLSKSSLRFKSRTNLIIHPNKNQNKFTNVFSTPVKSHFGSTSMSSTFQSIHNSDEKSKSSIFAEVTQRKNLFTLPLKFKDQKKLPRRDVDENQTLTVRPKSSFKNLKEKNEYFQMRQSERKKSLKKDVNNNVLNNQPKIHQKMSPKSSEIKAEYGL